jgi:SRSO17 transposase
MKEELGLDHFEGRSWSGLHHHAVLTMVAYGFLQHLRLKEAAAASPPRSADETPAERGKNRPRKARATPALRPSA